MKVHLDRLLTALDETGTPCAAEEIADIVWLAAWMTHHAPPVVEAPQSTPSLDAEILDDKSTAVPPREIAEAPVEVPDSGPMCGEDSEGVADVHILADAAVNSERFSGKPIQAPAAPALPARLALARSLRPLTRRVPSRTVLSLDVEDTVRHLADGDVGRLTLRPAAERWLTVTLVIDESLSMNVWKQTAVEFHRLLQWTGAFRDLRFVHLQADGSEPTFSRARQPAMADIERESADGRQLILVFSDCVSKAWRTGSLFARLKSWSATATVALVQALPEPMWSRTSLGQARLVRVKQTAPGRGQAGFRGVPLDPWMEPPVPGGFLLPVADLEPGLLGSLAGLIAGSAGWSAGIVVPESGLTSVPTVALTSSAEERVATFQQTASPTAIRLAGLVAVSPTVSLQVIRLIRQACLPEARQVHEAEFLLSGLLHATSVNSPATMPERPLDDDVSFRFYPVVDDLLLDNVTVPDSLDVLSRVSHYVEQRLGIDLRSFRAILADPTIASGEVSVSSHPFVQIAARRLRRLGGDYARWAKRWPQATTNQSATVAPPPSSAPSLDESSMATSEVFDQWFGDEFFSLGESSEVTLAESAATTISESAQTSAPEPRLPLPTNWEPLPLTAEEVIAAAEDIVRFGQSTRLAGHPHARYGDFETYDPNEVRSLTALEQTLRANLQANREQRPLSLASFGPQHSGQGFQLTSLVRHVADSLRLTVAPFEFDMSQFDSREELIPAVREAVYGSLGGPLAMVLFVDFDAKLGNARRGWLKHLLSAMQDGVFRDAWLTVRFESVVFGFVSYSSPTLRQFMGSNEDADRNSEQLSVLKESKTSDFLSRLSGSLDCLGLNPASPDDKWFVLRRATTLRSLLTRSASGSQRVVEGSLNIPPEFLRALLQVRHYRHGIRSLIAILQMLDRSEDNAFRWRQPPHRDALEMHVDADEFLALAMRSPPSSRFNASESSAEPSHAVIIDQLARAMHENFLDEERRSTSLNASPSLGAFDMLAEEIQSTLRLRAERCMQILSSWSIRIVQLEDSVDRGATLTEAETESIAEREHESWCQERLAQGFRYDLQRDFHKKTHPDLVPWQDLPDSRRIVQRSFARTLSNVISRAGFKLVRQPSEDSRIKDPSPANTPRRLFLSYSRLDATDFARMLRRDLIRRGFDVREVSVEFPAASTLHFSEILRDAVTRCDQFVLILTPRVTHSEHVREEWRVAYDVKIPITPVLRLGSSTLLPVELQGLSCADFRDDTAYSKQLEELVRRLLASARITSKQAGTPMREPAVAVAAPEPPRTTSKLVGVPVLPAYYVPRPDVFLAAKQALLTEGNLKPQPVLSQSIAPLSGISIGPLRLVGLHGPEGIGKSVLARALAHDREVRTAFPDGIVWIALDTLPDIVDQLRVLHRDLGGDGRFDSEREGRQRLQIMLEEKAVLLILDDAVNSSDVAVFNRLGARCRLIVTTRHAGLVPSLGGLSLVVPPLSAEESRQFFQQLAEAAFTTLSNQDVDEIVGLCRGVPRFLRLFGEEVRFKTPLSEIIAAVCQLEVTVSDEPSSRDPLPPKPSRPEAPVCRSGPMTLRGHEGPVRSVAYSPDGRRIVSGSADGTLRIWNVVSGAVLLVLRGHDDSVGSVSWSHDGNRIVSGSDDRTIHIWDSESGGEVAILRGHIDRVRSVGWSPDGTTIVSGSRDGTVGLWSADLGTFQGVVSRANDQVTSVTFSPNGSRIAVGTWDAVVRLVEVKSSVFGNAFSKELEYRGHEDRVRCVAWSPTGDRIASGSRDGTLRICDLGMSELVVIDANVSIGGLSWSPDGLLIAAGSEDGRVRVWDAQTGKVLLESQNHEGAVSSVAFSPDGCEIASGSRDTTIRLWDMSAL